MRSAWIAASMLVATASGSDTYRIAGVPGGRYRLTAWNEKLPPVSRAVQVGAEGTLRADIALGPVEP